MDNPETLVTLGIEPTLYHKSIQVHLPVHHWGNSYFSQSLV